MTVKTKKIFIYGQKKTFSFITLRVRRNLVGVLGDLRWLEVDEMFFC